MEKMKSQKCIGVLMVAHYGNFSFTFLDKTLSDLVSAEGIKVFRIEKHAHKHDVVVTNDLLRMIKEDLKERGIRFRSLGKKDLKGFDEETELFRLIFPARGEKATSGLLDEKMADLEMNTRDIPVFGDPYPPMSMAENFIDLDIGSDRQVRQKDFQYRGPDLDDREIDSIALKPKEEKYFLKDIPRTTLPVTRLVELEEYRRGVILGLPGSGKTTILKYFAFRDFEINQAAGRGTSARGTGSKRIDSPAGKPTGLEDRKRVVVFAQCRDILSYEEWLHRRRHPQDAPALQEPRDVETILDYFTWNFLFKSDPCSPDPADLARAEKKVHQAYYNGRLTLLVDALDEAKNNGIKEKILYLLGCLFEKAAKEPIPGNRFYLTSRYSEEQSFWRGKKTGFLKPVLRVRSLDKEQLREMAEYFYKDRPGLFQEFSEVVWREEIAAKVGGTPLTALLVIAYYEIYKNFDTRYHMYQVIVLFILLRAWTQIKEGCFGKDIRAFFEDARFGTITGEQGNRETEKIYDALTLLAYAHQQPARTINEENILGIFKLFAAGNVPGQEAYNEAAGWLAQLTRDHMLVFAGCKQYVFIHSTVMEFLSARYLVRRWHDPGYLKQQYDNKEFEAGLGKKDREFFASETLPIAVGSGIELGAAIIAWLHRSITGCEDDRLARVLYITAVKSLAEWESYIDRQYRRESLELLHVQLEKQVEQHLAALEWVYKYLAGVILENDKARVRAALENFRPVALSRLSREYLFDGYLGYEEYNGGDSELVALRRDLLYCLVKEETLDEWLAKHDRAFLPKAQADRLLTLDTDTYHPLDKNFHYYREHTPGLTGVYGSPNLKHSSWVNCAVVTADGRYIISGSFDNTLKLWDLTSGKEIRTFKGHKDLVTSVILVPGENRIVSASWDHTLRLWDLETGQCLKTIDLLWIPLALQIDPDHPFRLITANANCTLSSFDMREWFKD
jgi:hypothetical protein